MAKRAGGYSPQGLGWWAATILRTVGSLLAVILVAVGSQLLTTEFVSAVPGVEDTTVHWNLVGWGLAFVVSGVVFAGAVLYSVQRTPYDFSRAAMRNPKPCEVLVLSLSYLPRRNDPNLRPGAATLEDLDDAMGALGPCASLRDAAKALQGAKQFNWVVSFVALAHHLESSEDSTGVERGPLCRVAVVGSGGVSQRSFDQIQAFVQRVNQLLPNGARQLRLLGPAEAIPEPDDCPDEVIVVDRSRHAKGGYGGVDFERIESVHEAVRELVDDLTKQRSGWWRRFWHPRHTDVAIDFTGGMKMVSVGAALASLESNAYLQYSNYDSSMGEFVVTGYDYGLTERTSLSLG